MPPNRYDSLWQEIFEGAAVIWNMWYISSSQNIVQSIKSVSPSVHKCYPKKIVFVKLIRSFFLTRIGGLTICTYNPH